MKALQVIYFIAVVFLEQVVGVIKYNTIAKVLPAGDEELR